MKTVMKKNYMLLTATVLTASLLIMGADIVDRNKMLDKSKQSNLFQVKPDPFVYDDFTLTDLEITDWNRTRYIQLKEKATKGRAEEYFLDETGKYDITIFCSGISKSSLELFINDKSIGKLSSGRQKTFSSISVQKWSKLRIEFISTGGERILFEKLTFTPSGTVEASLGELKKPSIPLIFETRQQVTDARNMLDNYIRSRLNELSKKRMDELASLKTPAEWRARQKMIRAAAALFREIPGKDSAESKDRRQN
jgi:hypothetical protein